MDMHDPTTQYYALSISAVAILLAFLLYQPTGFVKWLQKKNYQYEVTFALYMLTPTEKFIFNSVLFLTLSMLTLATFVYLPDHVGTISRRTYYYFAGEAGVAGAADVAQATLHETVDKATGLVSSAFEAAMHTVAVAQEVAGTGMEGAR